MTGKPRASRVAPHAFEPEPDAAADYFGRRPCRYCRLLGTPGDHRHPHGALPPPALPPAVAAAARDRDAAVLGEREEGHPDA